MAPRPSIISTSWTNSGEATWARMKIGLTAAAESDTQCADDVVHAIFTSMDDFSRGHQTDDATVVVIRVH